MKRCESTISWVYLTQNKLCRVWLKDVDAITCVSRRQAEIIGRLGPELSLESLPAF
ncbi:MAG: hypothetical protein QW096_12710 [Thermofilaceae archaeon]